MRTCLMAVAFAICWTATLVADGFTNCYTRVTPDSDNFIVTVISRCWWTVGGEVYKAMTLRGQTTVAPSGTYATCYGEGYCGMSAKPPYTASTTYTSTATFKASQLFTTIDETTVTDTATTPDPIRPHTTCPSCCEYSPIVISLRGDYQLTSVENGVSFDINADGVAERLSWTAAGSDLAFLALDRNHNGRIDDGSELFGDAIAADGWIALAQLDGNRDGVIDDHDAAWNELQLWCDRDHDGRSNESELTSVASSGIASIGTSYRWSGRRDAFGNMFRYAGEITLAAGRRSAYDIYFLAAR